ncbi:hypothetical protein FOZ60_013455 [Perkinsus olseni]|uniref:Uncharacterized protein n=1 Tax=Perkinsus olseni TaxID=32597 RepID=A0A7J6NAD8_PEROL|nr:hypothetical protein FOZ60_013455 [Perkinsus olseni]
MSLSFFRSAAPPWTPRSKKGLQRKYLARVVFSGATALICAVAIVSTLLIPFILLRHAPVSTARLRLFSFLRPPPMPLPQAEAYGGRQKGRGLKDDHYVTAGDLVDPLSGRPKNVDLIVTAERSGKRGRSADLWTDIQCTGDRLNRSCIFDNFYYTTHDERFHILLPSFGEVRRAPYLGRPVDPSEDSTSLYLNGEVTFYSVAEVLANCSDFFMGDVAFIPTGDNFSPVIHILETAEEAREWIASVTSPYDELPRYVEGLTAYGFSLYMHNTGHLLYDGIYPLFISMLRFGYGGARVNAALRIVYNDMHRPGQSVTADEIIPTFFGANYYKLGELPDRLYQFQRVIVGSRNMAQRSLNLRGTMPGSYSFENALYYFTQRLKASYGLAPWKGLMSPQAPVIPDRAASGCRGVLTDNKRFTDKERAMLQSVLAAIRRSGRCNIIFLKWEDYTFREQLQIFADSDVYISGVGTGITRAHMIKPGGVVVNLGELESLGYPPRLQASYRDVQFSTGAPYLFAMFYPPKLWNVYGELQPEAVRFVIERAIDKVKEGFRLPRPLEDGLSHVGKSFDKYCKRSPADCEDLEGQLNPYDRPGDDYWCALCSWPEYIGLDSMWKKGQSCEWYDETRRCRLNYRLFDRCRSPDHLAFDKECHEGSRGAMRRQRERLLGRQAARLGFLFLPMVSPRFFIRGHRPRQRWLWAVPFGFTLLFLFLLFTNSPVHTVSSLRGPDPPASLPVAKASSAEPSRNGSSTYLRADQLTDPMSGRPSTTDYVALEDPYDHPQLWTSVQCTGSRLNRSCIFDNFYYVPSEEKFHIVLPASSRIRSAPYAGRPVEVAKDVVLSGPYDGSVVTEASVRSLIDGCSDFFMGDVDYEPTGNRFEPIIHILDSPLDAQMWVMYHTTTGATFRPGLTVYGFALYMHNVGHALYDGIYPMFISMLRFGYGAADVNVLFKMVYNGVLKPGMHVIGDDIAPVFGGGTYTHLDDLTDPLYRFQRVIVGSRRMAHRSFNTYSTLPGSYTYENALWYFSRRLQSRYGLIDSKTAMDPAAEIKPGVRDGTCRGVITDNKRFDAADRKMFYELIDKLKDEGVCDFTFVDWKKYSFEEQLELFTNSDVYVSGVGTGITRAHLTRPGGAVVNLGELEKFGTPERVQISYRDVQFAAGAPYLQALYYPAKLWNVYGRLQPEAVELIVRQAVDRVKTGWTLPRPLEDGISIVGEAMAKYCRASPSDCEDLESEFNVDDRPDQDDPWCSLCMWPDYIGLDTMWRADTTCEWYDKTRQCKLNYALYDSCRSPDHLAFDAKCHEESRPAMQELRERLLAERASELGVTVEKLSPEEATEALLTADPPSCPPTYVSGELCWCKALVW